MSISHVNDVEFGAELPAFEPDTRLATGAQFAELIGWGSTLCSHGAPKKRVWEQVPGSRVKVPRRNDPRWAPMPRSRPSTLSSGRR